MEMTVTEEEVVYTHKPLRDTSHHTDCTWEHRVSQEQGLRGKLGQNLNCGFRGKEWTKQGKQV